MEKYYVSTNLWVKFCMNYPDIREVIHWICERVGREDLENHLNAKFNRFYDLCGCYGVMSMFYCDLNKELQDALVEYAITVWSPIGMNATFEANKELLGL